MSDRQHVHPTSESNRSTTARRRRFAFEVLALGTGVVVAALVALGGSSRDDAAAEESAARSVSQAPERDAGTAEGSTDGLVSEGDVPEADVSAAGTPDGDVPEGGVPDVTTHTLVPPTPADPPPIAPPKTGEFALPCGNPGDASGPGVDDGRIAIGVGNDRGEPASAGSARGVVDAVRVLADRCNAAGGIAGRQVVVVELDAAVGEVDRRMREACEDVHAVVGSAYLLDGAGEATRIGCRLPAVPTWNVAMAADAEYLAAAVPTDADPVSLLGQGVALISSDNGAKVALVSPDTPGGAAGRFRRGVAMFAAPEPYVAVAEIGYPIDDTADWPAIVAQARNAGAGVVHIAGSCEMAVMPFLRAATAVGWNPAVLGDAGAYDPACVAAAGDAALERFLVEMPLLPVEDGDAAPTTGAVAALYAEFDVPVDGETLRAASAFWLWATAASNCGATVDRACVAAALVDVDEWTGGGLHAPSDPGSSTMEPCVVLMGVDDGAFVRRAPVESGTFDCGTGAGT